MASIKSYYQIEMENLKNILELELVNAIIQEVKQKGNYEEFSFKSIANRVNQSMNKILEYYFIRTSPEFVEIFGIHPIRKEDKKFHITDDETLYMIHHSDVVKNNFSYMK